MLIRRGARGAAVRDIQERLKRAVDPALPIDGVFGDDTYRVVRHFQRERGLAADGIVGPETWRELIEAGFTLGDRVLCRTRLAMRGDDVHELQHRLNQLGFDAGPEDGIFGPLAQSAVEDFQRNVGLVVDGIAGPVTVEALRRLHRDHQCGGVGIRAREREALRHLCRRGLTGARILIDPSHGESDPGHVGTAGATEADVTWAISKRLSARLQASGAHAPLSRGSGTCPSGSTRAQLANDLGVDVVVSIGTNALETPTARGSSTYYFGTERFVSEAGWHLAEMIQREMVRDGWRPDGRVHPMTWAILRETRMPAVVAEPGFLTSPHDAQRLQDPMAQDQLAEALTRALRAFFEAPPELRYAL